MVNLSKQQDAVRRFILSELRAGRPCPTHREIASHFGFASSYAAACHLKALVKKGILIAERGKARALQLAEVFPGVRRPLHSKFRCSVPSLPDLLMTKARNLMDASSSIFPPLGLSRRAILSACAS